MPGYAILGEPWWIPVLWVIAIGHVTNVCNTLYLHRSATHGGVVFHPVVEHMMRFWCWLVAGIVTKEWVAVHRKHHAYADREGDPHSPTVEGLANIALNGLFFYRRAAQDQAVLDKYGKGTPDDWVERNIYTKRRGLGVKLMLVLSLFLFGIIPGFIVWTCMVFTVPLMGNIINGLGHALGYRTFGTRDDSHNLYPWGIWILGEELHNNHHADPRSAKFKAHWWEFDIGWFYIRILQLLRLADVLYARSASPREFAARFYRDSADRVSGRLERAVARVQRTREAGLRSIERAREEGRSRLETLRAGGRAKLDRVPRARLDQLKEECLTRLDRAAEKSRARLDRIKTGKLGRLDAVKAEARTELDRAREAARTRLLRAVEAITLESRPATD
ncbi:fatty acid desaturase [Candidatus Palauibacter sp.]|uniref:acyl-CoA desaturase n=1 Tax=Candidatus Palauibacter sp. TaxID=3101350 RepID=UPI003B51AD01